MSEKNSGIVPVWLSCKSAKLHFCLVLVVALLLSGGSVRAELLNLTLKESPDIFSGYIDVTYDAGNNAFAFASTGYALTFYNGVEQIDFDVYTEDSFSISATVNELGVASSGSLTITGQVAGYGATGPLLTGNLTNFGFGFWDTLNPESDAASFEFLFEVSGGEMAGLYGGQGASIGVIMGGVSVGADVTEQLFTADFDNLFGNGPGYGTAVSDTGTPMPEPVSLLLLGLGGLILSKRKK